MLETFHGKLVFAWYECLTSLFTLLVDKHFSGTRQFKELKTCQLKIDFQKSIDVNEQIKNSLSKNFDFDTYKDKIKIINSVLNPGNKRENELRNIHKHIQIRNSFQHKAGKIDKFFLQELGVQDISLLDNDSIENKFIQDNIINLSIPEFDLFRKSIVLVAQTWRQWNG